MQSQNTNIASIVIQRDLRNSSDLLAQTQQRLSSGLRINQSSDDAAGLQISHLLRAQLRGIEQASKNLNEGQSVINIVEGSMSVIQDYLQRIRELTVQAANDTNSTSNRGSMKTEIVQILDDIDRIARSTQFNGSPLLVTATPANYYLQIGQNAVASVDRINIGPFLGDMTTSISLSIRNTVWTIGTASTAAQFLGRIDAALAKVSNRRSNLGAAENRLQGTLKNVLEAKTNLSNSESRIRSADIASETSEFTRAQILQNSAISMLSQANNNPRILLQLLQQ